MQLNIFNWAIESVGLAIIFFCSGYIARIAHVSTREVKNMIKERNKVLEMAEHLDRLHNEWLSEHALRSKIITYEQAIIIQALNESQARYFQEDFNELVDRYKQE